MNFIIILLFLCYVNYSRACNGYSVKVSKYRNCIDNSIIKLPEKGFDIILDKDCNLYATGCVEITKNFKTAKGSYHVKKPPLPLIEGEIDLCQARDMLKDTIPDIVKGIEDIGIPTHCPVKAAKICNGPEKKVNFGKFKNQIGMAAGNTELRVEVDHDVGKTCVEINFSLSKPRKG